MLRKNSNQSSFFCRVRRKVNMNVREENLVTGYLPHADQLNKSNGRNRSGVGR